ncbi:MAG: type VI secretion system baseplate subunit TssE [Granulosicoccus sp.]|nr:type VI secretion system baseplate subunit TssE [Granulosicoccus sp.]
MAELTAKDRLLPSLIDRLTDTAPGQRDETRDARTGTMESLRASVLRDLEWLMNTVNLDSAKTLEEFPDLEPTTINYGMPALSGAGSNDATLAQIERQIKKSVLAFEPRILKSSLRVKLLQDADLENRHAIAFQIEGTLWGQPMPEALFLHTELDLEIGEVKVKDV